MAPDSSRLQPLPDTSALIPQLPRRSRPVLIIGAGGIVRTAHLPAYAKVPFPVIGIVDTVRERAESLAGEHGVARAFQSIE